MLNKAHSSQACPRQLLMLDDFGRLMSMPVHSPYSTLLRVVADSELELWIVETIGALRVPMSKT